MGASSISNSRWWGIIVMSHFDLVLLGLLVILPPRLLLCDTLPQLADLFDPGGALLVEELPLFFGCLADL